MRVMRQGWGLFALLLVVAVLALIAVHSFAVRQLPAPGPPEHRLEQLAPLEAPGARIAEGAGRQEDGQWTMPAGDYASTRFTGLDQINTGNARTCGRSSPSPPASTQRP